MKRNVLAVQRHMAFWLFVTPFTSCRLQGISNFNSKPGQAHETSPAQLEIIANAL
jgi:hypothetical protein